MSRIFISYRREDSDIWAGRLADELRKHFSAEQVFQDIASIDPGADFPTVLEEALATAAVMLVVIGPRWLSATDKNGRKRLESPADFVHQEVAESLRSPAVRVFPLLVNGAAMPAEEELPDPLKPLARRNAIELTVRHWASDVAQLVQTLKRSPGVAATRAGDETASRGPEYEELAPRSCEGCTGVSFAYCIAFDLCELASTGTKVGRAFGSASGHGRAGRRVDRLSTVAGERASARRTGSR